METKFYLFTQRGITDRFFCGNIYERQPNDEINYHGCPMTFSECEQQELCKSFDSMESAKDFSRSEESAMEDSNNYASCAMDSEDTYGCEGVDDMRFENNY